MAALVRVWTVKPRNPFKSREFRPLQLGRPFLFRVENSNLAYLTESLNNDRMPHSDTLDAALKALAHPTRRAILAQLAQGDATVNELADPIDMSLPAVSRHIKVLEDAGLITRGKNAQFRPCQINPTPIKAVITWAESYRPIWEARFDKMETLLNAKKETNND